MNHNTTNWNHFAGQQQQQQPQDHHMMEDPHSMKSIVHCAMDLDHPSIGSHICAFNGCTGRMSLSEARVIANTITSSIEPLMKWVSLKHAIDRGCTVEELFVQFPWLDVHDDEEYEYTTDDEDDDDEDDDEDEDEDEDDEDDEDEVSDLEEGELEPDIPRSITVAVRDMWDLTEVQMDTIMQLISLPENGSTKWPLFYNYIEYGKDATLRGFTTTIFGATTGTGSLLEVFRELEAIDADHPLVVTYMDALEKACGNGGDIRGLEGLAHVNGDPTKAVADYSNWTPNGRTHLDHIDGDLARLHVDERWRLAVWRAFLRLNWESAIHFCLKSGPCEQRPGPVLTTPLAKGFLVDTSLNHGDCRYWNEASSWTAIWDNMGPDAMSENDETVWLRSCMKARKKVLKSGYLGLDWSKSGDRVNVWRSLLRDGNVDLNRPIRVRDSSHNPPIWPNGLEIL